MFFKFATSWHTPIENRGACFNLPCPSSRSTDADFSLFYLSTCCLTGQRAMKCPDTPQRLHLRSFAGQSQLARCVLPHLSHFGSSLLSGRFFGGDSLARARPFPRWRRRLSPDASRLRVGLLSRPPLDSLAGPRCRPSSLTVATSSCSPPSSLSPIW